MSVPTLIYLCVTGLAALLCLWAVASAVRAEADTTPLRRLVTAVSVLGLLAATGVASVGPWLGLPRLAWAIALLPPLVLAVSWSNVVTLGGERLAVKMTAMPIMIFNLVLVGTYASIGLQDCFGVDLGPWGCALGAANAHVQVLIGHPDAATNPIYLLLPIVLPLWNGMRLFRLIALFTASCVATVPVLATLMVMPHSYGRSESYRTAVPAVVSHRTPIGLHVPWGQRLLTDTEIVRVRVHVQLLGAGQVVCEAGPWTFADAALRTQTAAEIAWARNNDRQTTVVTRPPRDFAAQARHSLNDLQREMEQTQWLVAEGLQPDRLVLFAGPYASLATTIAASASATDWLAAVRKSAGEIRQAKKKDIELAVAFATFDSRSARLFALLDADSSPIDVIGLSFHPGDDRIAGLESDLARLATWLEHREGDRPITVTACGCSPRTNGGETGQWNFVSRVLAFTEGRAELAGVGLDAIYDERSDLGLIGWSGRRRLTYHELAAGARLRAARPGK